MRIVNITMEIKYDESKNNKTSEKIIKQDKIASIELSRYTRPRRIKTRTSILSIRVSNQVESSRLITETTQQESTYRYCIDLHRQ
jgi:hypothetical protein